MGCGRRLDDVGRISETGLPGESMIQYVFHGRVAWAGWQKLLRYMRLWCLASNML